VFQRGLQGGLNEPPFARRRTAAHSASPSRARRFASLGCSGGRPRGAPARPESRGADGVLGHLLGTRCKGKRRLILADRDLRPPATTRRTPGRLSGRDANQRIRIADVRRQISLQQSFRNGCCRFCFSRPACGAGFKGPRAELGKEEARTGPPDWARGAIFVGIESGCRNGPWSPL